MKQFAIIGLGTFGIRMLERLAENPGEIIIVDRDAEVIEKYKDMAKAAYIADALNEQALSRIVPEGIDAAIVDVGSNIEAAILVTNFLKKMGIEQVIVKADSDERGEILKLVGATRVVYPDREAASQIVPMLVSPMLFTYMPLSSSLVMAELLVPEKYVGMTLIEANMRQALGINVIALRKTDSQEYRFFQPGYRLQDDDVLLMAGPEKEVLTLSGAEGNGKRKDDLGAVFKKLFTRKKK